MQEITKIKEQHNTSENEFLFLTGLGLLILYFILANPATPNFHYSTTVFWMAATLLVLTIVPDYLNYQSTQQWLIKRKNSKTQSFYEKLQRSAQATHRHFNSILFCAAFLLTLTAIANLLLTGAVLESHFGASYGLFMKAVLSPTPKRNTKEEDETPRKTLPANKKVRHIKD